MVTMDIYQAQPNHGMKYEHFYIIFHYVLHLLSS